MQETQYIPLYAYCEKSVTGELIIEMPRIKALENTKYYELVIMPTGPALSQTGFANNWDT